MKLLPDVKADVVSSDDGRYRYALTRHWFPKRGKGDVLWIMLNPSVADATTDDRTLRKCQKFARAWGYDGVLVGNLFGLRSTDPRALRKHRDPVGGANDLVLESLFRATGIGLVVAAWGAPGRLRHRDAAMIKLASEQGRTLHALGVNADGTPRHPLYVLDGTEPVVYREPA